MLCNQSIRLVQQLHGTLLLEAGTWSTVQNLCQMLKAATQLLLKNPEKFHPLKKQFATPLHRKKQANWFFPLITLLPGEERSLLIVTLSANPPWFRCNTKNNDD